MDCYGLLIANDKENRRAIRGHRRSSFPPIGFFIRFTEPLYTAGDIGWVEWEGR